MLQLCCQDSSQHCSNFKKEKELLKKQEGSGNEREKKLYAKEVKEKLYFGIKIMLNHVYFFLFIS